MNSTFTIIISESFTDSWPDIVWQDAKDMGARVCLDYSKPIPAWLRKLRKIHFSNPANRRIWLPMKTMWDWTNALRLDDLDPNKRNYIIFQTGIKFSAHYIKRLKEERNACIVLYMPDNISTMGIANNIAEFERYCHHYHVDQVYSFDKKDCETFGMEFFDFYSILPIVGKSNLCKGERLRVFYVGSCRSRERLDILHRLYDHLSTQADCTFYLNGVDEANMTRNGFKYNHPLTYKQVIELVQQNDIIVEIMNGCQTGNTLRLKEAVCYNKLLLTNNQTITDTPYYNSKYMQVFNKVDEIDLSKFCNDVDYHYQGEYSPRLLMERIIEKDNIYQRNKTYNSFLFKTLK